MIFSDPLFLFIFLPLVWGCWALATARSMAGANRVGLSVLLAGSVLFYGWNHVGNLVLFLCAIAFNFLAAHAITRMRGLGAALMLAAAIAANLLLLATYKYYGFFTGSSLYLILPLAISFYTFQQIAYLVDSYRTQSPERRPLRYAFFVGFFPQLIAGPIVTYAQVRDQIGSIALSCLTRENVVAGIQLLAIGLAKKVLLADTLAPVSDSLFAASGGGLADGPPGWTLAWLGTLAFYLQIYFDFSGYSDMALGLARLFNLRLPQNFASPYRAGSPIEFWRRWHMTLSAFLRDYLYKPLGGSRHGRVRTVINLMAVMILGGLWHGAAITFVVWGALHGAALVANHLLRGRRLIRWPIVAVILTQLVVLAGWVLFRANSLAEAGHVFQALASWPAPSWDIVVTVGQAAFSTSGPIYTAIGLGPTAAAPLLLATLGLGCLIVWTLPNSMALALPARTGAAAVARLILLLAPTLAVLAQRASQSAVVEPFIYFQF